jgi:hypothetical protein
MGKNHTFHPVIPVTFYYPGLVTCVDSHQRIFILQVKLSQGK